MFLKTLTDPEYSGHQEELVIKRDEDLWKEMTNNGVTKVVCPMILIGSAGYRMLGPVVEGVDPSPEPRVNMKSSVHPVHAKRHDIMIDN